MIWIAVLLGGFVGAVARQEFQSPEAESRAAQVLDQARQAVEAEFPGLAVERSPFEAAQPRYSLISRGLPTCWSLAHVASAGFEGSF